MDSEDEVSDELSSSGGSSSVSDHASLPKTQAAQVSRKHRASSGSPENSSARASTKFLVEDGEVSGPSSHASADSDSDEAALADYWAMKARGELESDSGASGSGSDVDSEDDAFSSTGDEFSTDSEMEMEEAEAEAYNEGVLQQELVYGEETRRIAVVNCDWERLRAVDLMVVCSSFCPSTGLVKAVHIFPSDFGLSMLEEENRNGPSVFADETSSGIGGAVGDVVTKSKHKLEENEETQAALDQIKLRRYELNKLRYYFAVVTCDSIATASAIYNALDNQEIEMTSNKLDMRFVPDDISFDDRQIHDVCTEVPLNYEAPNFYTTVLQKTEAKLTWDQTPKDRLSVTQAAFSHLAEIDEAKYSQFLASSESEDGEDEEEEENDKDNIEVPAPAEDADATTIKKKARAKYASLLLGLDGLNEDGEKGEPDGEDDFFATSKAPSGEKVFVIGGTKPKAAKQMDDADIKRKVQEKLEQQPKRKFKINNVRSVQPKYRPDEKLEEEEEIYIEEEVSGDEVNGMKDESSVSDSDSPSEPVRGSKHSLSSSKHSKKDSGKQRKEEEESGADEDVGEEGVGASGGGGDIWAGFDDAFKKPSKSQLKNMKKRKREEREKAMKEDTKTRDELRLLMSKTGGGDGGASTDDGEDGVGTEEDDEEGGPRRKKKRRGEKGEPQRTEINLQDARFASLMKDPRFMPDPTNPNFKKTAAVSAILEARKEYRKTHLSRGGDDDEEDLDAHDVDKRSMKAMAKKNGTGGGRSTVDSSIVSSSSSKKVREAGDDDDEMPALIPASRLSSSSSSGGRKSAKKHVQSGFYDMASSTEKKKNTSDSKMELDDLVASVKRKASNIGRR